MLPAPMMPIFMGLTFRWRLRQVMWLRGFTKYPVPAGVPDVGETIRAFTRRMGTSAWGHVQEENGITEHT